MDERSAKFELDRACLLRLRELGLELHHFFDVGASDGAWTHYMAPGFKEASFDLFEPLMDHVPELCQEIDKTLVGPQFRLHHLALGAHSKLATMYLYPDNLRGSTALELTATPKNARPVSVHMLTMDDAIEKLALPLPDVVKMDTQGCELNILQGACKTLPSVKALFLECWLVRAYGATTPLLLEIADFLRNYDFHFWDFTGQWRDGGNTLGAQDCVFLNARCKESPLSQEPRRMNNSLHAQRPAGFRRWFQPRKVSGKSN